MVRVWNNSASNKLWVRQLMVLYYWRMVSRWVVCTAFESAILFLHSLHYMFLWTHIICHEYGTTSSCIQNALFNSIFQMDPWKLRGYECIVMTCQWRWLESLTTCQAWNARLLYLSVWCLCWDGWWVRHLFLKPSWFIYLFIFGFGEEGGGWCLWQIGGESVSSIFSTQQRCLLFACSRIINTISLPLPGIMS